MGDDVFCDCGQRFYWAEYPESGVIGTYCPDCQDVTPERIISQAGFAAFLSMENDGEEDQLSPSESASNDEGHDGGEQERGDRE